MSNVFPRNNKEILPIAVAAKGCYLIDSNGKQYLDGSSGAAISALGHSDREVIEAIKKQLDTMAFAHTSFFSSKPSQDLARKLIEGAPGTLDRVHFVAGGSEAIEAAIKLARQYFVEIGEKQKYRVIARRQSYHGNTLGALAVGGHRKRRQHYQELLMPTTHISPCYEYRGKKIGETSQQYGQRVADELEEQILKLGPQNVMAFIAETVVGSTLGAVPAVEGYFKKIRAICDRYEVLLILDEVMCGMARTGSLFACQQEGVAPDILAIAKGLGAGYQPIGAMLCTDKIYRTIGEGSGFFQHGHSYNGHPTACAAALAVIEKINKLKLAQRAEKMGDKLQKNLRDSFSQHPHIGDIRGKGLLCGIEIVKDRETKEPFEKKCNMAKLIKKTAFHEGLLCYPDSGSVDGEIGDHILLAPPLVLDENHIEEIVDKLKKTFAKILP